ncbi:hypothetical protein CCR75_006977 [Bremia lactucae]|uniref:Uncharacterized protein n=1 Tax=Bremia lactucae TaxID=4779 RepID=A0A976FKZ8_BRELC|nr:hypothetical protein CCR75_006977 [Bremia lactucae]
MLSYMAAALGILSPSESSPPSHTSPTNHKNGFKRMSLRLRSRGWLDRENELFILIPRNATATCNIIFFPGDVQDFQTNMATGPFADYSDYAYESVAELLSKKFGNTCNVWIVRPHRFKHGAYSSFDNFLTTNEYGAATKYDATGSSTKHLASLMQNTQILLRRQGVNVSTVLPIRLLGFSKGGIVLNQLVTELVRYSFNKKRSNSGQVRHGSVFASTRQFFAAIQSIHWLDPGNGSLKGTMPLEEAALAVLARYKQVNYLWFLCVHLQLFVHVTPYQYNSRDRAWIKTEVENFIKKMKLRGADSKLIVYNEGGKGSLASHFHILNDFEVDRPSKLNGDRLLRPRSPERINFAFEPKTLIIR